MAWNRQSPTAKNNDKRMKRVGAMRSAACGIVIVVLAVVAWVFFRDDASPAVDREPAKSRRIKETQPAVVSRTETDVGKPMKQQTEAERIFAETNGMSLGAIRQWEFKNWKGKVVTGGVHRVQTLEEKVFANGAERMIAGLLRIEPGTPMIGDSKALFNKRFLENFKKSLVEPALVKSDDTDEVKQLKRAVTETKAELKERMDAGEDICKLLAETRDDLKSLGLYRQDLEKMVKESIRDGNLSDEDAQTCVDAANKMLAERGAKPLKMPTLYMKMLKLKNSRHKEEFK